MQSREVKCRAGDATSLTSKRGKIGVAQSFPPRALGVLSKAAAQPHAVQPA